MPEATRKRGCDSCRERHLKCDRKQTCSNCAKRGQICSRVSKTRFRHAQDDSLQNGELGFSKNQKWCKITQRKIRFIDETYDITTLYDGRISLIANPSWEEGEDSSGTLRSPYQESPNKSPQATNLRPTIDGARRVLNSDTTQRSHSAIDSGLNLPSTVHESRSVLNSAYSVAQDNPTAPPLLAEVHSLLHQQTPLLYWCDKRLTELLRHFVENLAQLFDCGGFQRRFATSFPERAAQYRPLLQVMSAIGAISLKIMGKPSTASEKQLYWESYQHLGLNECQPVNEIGDDQFFTTIFLNIFDDLDRYLDFSNAPSTNNPQSRDQREMQMGDITLGNDLRQDMIWASLRLRLYFAVLNHEPDAVSLNVNNTTDDPFIVKRDDHYWARRMILHLHNVVNYCFGPEKNIAAYQVLVEYSQEWVASKPASFDPILIPADDSSSEFPGIFVLNDAAALGWQLYHLYRILLVAHDPSRPLLGLGGAVDRRSVDNSLKNDTIAICGIANSIGQIDAAHLPACMAISLTGHLFTPDMEQRALIAILVKTEKTLGWPTSSIQSHLKNAWEL